MLCCVVSVGYLSAKEKEMLRSSSTSAMMQYESTPYQAIEDYEDELVADEQEEQIALMRLDTEYFRVIENNSERLVLRNRPFWFSTCLGIFFLILSAPFVIPFFLIIWSATWEIVIFDRRRDSVSYRRRYVCGSFKTEKRLKLSDFDGFIVDHGYVSSRLAAIFKTGERIPLTNGLSEVGEERETVHRICRNWLSEGGSTKGTKQPSPSLKMPSSNRRSSSSRNNSYQELPPPSPPSSTATTTPTDIEAQSQTSSNRSHSSKTPKYKAPSSNVIDLDIQKDAINCNLLVGDTVYAMCSSHEDPTQWHEAVVEEVIYSTNESRDDSAVNDRFRLNFLHLNKREVVELNAINLEMKRTAPNSCPKF